MKTDRSAGIVVFRPATGDTSREYLLLDYGKYWDFAKGHPKGKETDREAAIRELEEETGITDCEITPGFAREIQYFYRDNKAYLIGKTVLFFLGSTTTEKITLSHEHVGYEFLSYGSARKRLTFSNSREILRHADEFLDRHPVNLGTK